MLRDLGTRTGVDDVRALSAVIIQAEKFGSSIASALRVQSDAMRLRRRQLAEERAAETSVKIMLPLILFIFPGVFVVLVGPAALSIMSIRREVSGGNPVQIPGRPPRRDPPDDCTGWMAMFKQSEPAANRAEASAVQIIAARIIAIVAIIGLSRSAGRGGSGDVLRSVVDGHGQIHEVPHSDHRRDRERTTVALATVRGICWVAIGHAIHDPTFVFPVGAVLLVFAMALLRR